MSTPQRHGLDVEQLLVRALEEPTALDMLIHMTELMHFTVELQHRLSPYRAAAMQYLLDDDRSNRWIAKQIGVTHQVIDNVRRRHEGQELPVLEPRFGASM